VSAQQVTFCFDFISPYAYVGWHAIQAIAARRQLELEVKPVLFAALLDHHGNMGPAEIPAKRVYVFKDALRTAAVHGLMLVPPPAHPFRPLLALRIAGLLDGAKQRAAIDALFAVAWGGARFGDAGLDDEGVAAAALDAAGLDGRALVARSRAPEVKAALRQATEEAIAADVFGVPSFIAGGEVFWGVDSLGHLERFLDGDDPATDEVLARWGALPATARRPGSAR
jgi:2-hydroxychromene-2-carboxylate isomerase